MDMIIAARCCWIKTNILKEIWLIIDTNNTIQHYTYSIHIQTHTHIYVYSGREKEIFHSPNKNLVLSSSFPYFFFQTNMFFVFVKTQKEMNEEWENGDFVFSFKRTKDTRKEQLNTLSCIFRSMGLKVWIFQFCTHTNLMNVLRPL